jgi:hypothetical protein
LSVALLGLLAALLALAPAAGAKVYLSRADGLRLGFGDSLRACTRTAFLDPEQVRQVRELARAPFDAARVTYYVGLDADSIPRLFGYIDTHVVRTMSETVLIVLDPAGSPGSVEVLSFDEPEDYIAPPRWRARLRGYALTERLRPGADLPNLAGATLTARALADAVRRSQAIHAVLHTSDPGQGSGGETQRGASR